MFFIIKSQIGCSTFVIGLFNNFNTKLLFVTVVIPPGFVFTPVASSPSLANSPTWYTCPPTVYWYATANTSSLFNLWFNEI